MIHLSLCFPLWVSNCNSLWFSDFQSALLGKWLHRNYQLFRFSYHNPSHRWLVGIGLFDFAKWINRVRCLIWIHTRIMQNCYSQSSERTNSKQFLNNIFSSIYSVSVSKPIYLLCIEDWIMFTTEKIILEEWQLFWK